LVEFRKLSITPLEIETFEKYIEDEGKVNEAEQVLLGLVF
jgi:hypothetical protein